MDTPESGLGNKAQQLDAIGKLRKQYGSSSKIPEADLSAIGYIRREMEDGLVRLMPKERLDELALKDPDWEKPLKEREQPFGRIPLELPTTTENFRFIPYSQSGLLSDKLTDVEYAFFPNWDNGTSILPDEELKIDVRVQNLNIFSQDILDFMKDKKVLGQEVDSDTYLQTLLFGALPMRMEPKGIGSDDPNGFEAYAFRRKYSELNRTVNSTGSKEMHEELSRLGGFFGDLDMLRKQFKKQLDGPTSIEAALDNPPNPKQLEALHKLDEFGIHTNADFIRFVFPKYLRHMGLDEMAAVTQTATSMDTLGESLQYLDAVDSTKTDEQEIKKALKIASAEERVELNMRLKSLDSAKRKRRQVRQGVIDYFSTPEVYVDVVNRKVKAAQDFLVGGSDKKSGQMQLVLDANSDPELDRDPGLVSGDCTVGNPLPFNNPSIPLYNVKALTEDGQHIGNVYLLVTNTKDDEGNATKKKVWHLDAIQIPRSTIQWEDGIERIVEAVAAQADSKGIDAVTANSQLHHISNYDYIARATEQYWDRQGRQMVNVEMPENKDTSVSQLQGTGTDIVLWSKERMSDVFDGQLESNDAMFNMQNQQGNF